MLLDIRYEDYFLFNPDAFDLEAPCPFAEGPISLLPVRYNHPTSLNFFLRSLWFVPSLSGRIDSVPNVQVVATYAINTAARHEESPWFFLRLYLQDEGDGSFGSEGYFPKLSVIQMVAGCSDSLDTDLQALSDANPLEEHVLEQRARQKREQEMIREAQEERRAQAEGRLPPESEATEPEATAQKPPSNPPHQCSYDSSPRYFDIGGENTRV